MKSISIVKKETDFLYELDDHEISLIRGGFLLPGFLTGMVAGGLAYTAEKAVSNEKMTVAGAITAAGVGGAAGFVGGPVSIARSIWTIDVAIGGGALTGVVNAMESTPRQDASYWSDFSFDFSTF